MTSHELQFYQIFPEDLFGVEDDEMGSVSYWRTNSGALTYEAMECNRYHLNDTVLGLLDHIIRGRGKVLNEALKGLRPSVVNTPIPFRNHTFLDSSVGTCFDRILLWWEAGFSTPDIIEMLVEFGATIDHPDGKIEFYKPLTAALLSNLGNMCKLLESGASVHARDATGRQTLHIAYDYAKDPENVSLILEYGAEVDSPVLELHGHLEYPGRGRTAVDLALQRRSRDYGEQGHQSAARMVHILLEAQADASR